MYAPIFSVCSASSSVAALVGAAPNVRLYPFGEAPESVIKPYVVWQTIGGNAENYLEGVPDTDKFELQIDIYGTTAAEVRSVAKAIRDAIELQAYVTSWNGESKDVQTKTYRYSFDVDWWVNR